MNRQRGNILRERPQRRPSEPQPQRPRGRGRAEAAKKEVDGRTCAWPRGARPKRPQRNMTRSPAGALAEAGFLLFVHLLTRFSALHSYPKHKRKRRRRLREPRAAAPSLYRFHRRSETKAHDERQHSPAQPDKGLGRAKQPKEMGKPNSAPDKLQASYFSARFNALFISVTSFASEYFIQLLGNRTFSA